MLSNDHQTYICESLVATAYGEGKHNEEICMSDELTTFERRVLDKIILNFIYSLRSVQT